MKEKDIKHIDINSEAFAYSLGFLLTDGNVYVSKNNSKTISLHIQNRDSYILDLFVDLYDGKITKKKHSKWRKHSIKLASFLENYGLFPNKTFSVRLPHFSNTELKRHLLRGIWDGDGSWYIKKNNLVGELCSASESFLNDINCYLSLLGFKHKTIRKRYKKPYKSPLYVISFYSKEARELHNFLYSNAFYFLNRKMEIINRVKLKTIHSNGNQKWNTSDLLIIKNYIKNNKHNLKELELILSHRSRKSISCKVSRIRSLMKLE